MDGVFVYVIAILICLIYISAPRMVTALLVYNIYLAVADRSSKVTQYSP